MRQLQKKLYFCTMKPTINRHRLNNLDRCIHYLLQQENLQAEIPSPSKASNACSAS